MFHVHEEGKPTNLLEIGNQAVWSLSSCKPGFGVANLRDGCTDSYWQSDGPQPHHVNIEFLKKTSVIKLAVYVDYRVDESYTPSKISIKAGSHFHDLALVTTIELSEPSGWVFIDTIDKQNRPVRGFLFQLSITANHQNGRDTHIRQVRVYEAKNHGNQRLDTYPLFYTADCLAYSTIR